MSSQISLILLLFFAFSFLFHSDNSFDQDLGRHIRIGEITLETGSVPDKNLFSYTNPDFPFVNHHYLFGILLFVSNSYLTDQTILIFKILIILSSVLLTLSLVKNYPLFLAISFIFLHILRERTELRPEIFSFLFTTLTLWILYRVTSNKVTSNKLFVLPLIQLLWVNIHIYFPLGLAIQGVFLIKLFYEGVLRRQRELRQFRVLSAVFGLSLLACLVNPSGVKGVLYPFTIFSNYGYQIVENQTMFLLESINFANRNFLFVKLAIFITLLSIIYAFFKKTLRFENLILGLAGVVMALMNVRSFPYLVFLSLPAVLMNLEAINGAKAINETKEIKGTKEKSPLIPLIASIALLFESLVYFSGIYYQLTDSDKRISLKLEESMKGSLDFVQENNLEGPLFNNFDIGSYIIYRAYEIGPESSSGLKVFVDGRPEAYPKEFFQQTYIPIQSDYQKFKEIEAKMGFKTIIFSITDQTPWGKNFLQNVVKDPEWKIVYLDHFGIVLVRNDQLAINNEQLKEIELKDLEPKQYGFKSSRDYINLSIFLLNIGETERALEFAKKALDINPQSPSANAILANIYASTNPVLSAQYAQRAKNWVWW